MNRVRCVSRFALPVLVLLGSARDPRRADGQTQPVSAPVRVAARPSASLAVSVAGTEVRFSASDLQALPQSSITVHNAHSNAEELYSGVKLTDLLTKAGASLGKGLLHSYVVAKGTDGYWVLLSGEEISDAAHTGAVLVATERDGKPLGGEGAFKLISSEDKRPERWVRQLESIHLVVVNP